MPGGVPVATVALNGAKNAGTLLLKYRSHEACSRPGNKIKKGLEESVIIASESLLKNNIIHINGFPLRKPCCFNVFYFVRN
jgi:hypothetical protein